MQGGDQGAAARSALNKRRVGRAVLALAGAVLMPCLVEVGLRAAHYGYPTAFLLPAGSGDSRAWIDNQFFGYRFFPVQATRTGQPLSVPMVKEPGEYRVVVLGESAAMGDPMPDFGLPRVLEVVLEDRLPGRRVRVINAAMTAINSHVVREIARELPKLRPDAVVLYMGNNEVVGPYGPATVLRAFSSSRGYVRASVLLGRTRLGQLLARARRAAAPAGPEATEWGGMSMFLKTALPEDDPRLHIVRRNFAANLEACLAAARSTGARVVVSTVAVNQRGCPPFGSRWHDGRDADAAAAREAALAQGWAREQAGDWAGALAAYQAAGRGDEGHAEQQYRLARALERMGREAEAADHYARARDLDTLRFRADTGINDLIRAGARDARALLLDAASELAGPGETNLFVDHVHFSFAGSVRVANRLADVLLDGAGAGVDAGGLERRCAERLAFGIAEQLELVETLRDRMGHPPFAEQRESAGRLAALSTEEQRLAHVLSGLSREEMRAPYDAAVAARPRDWVLRARRGQRLFEAGVREEALGDLQAALAAVPHRFDLRGDVANCLAVEGRGDEGVRLLRGTDRAYGHFLVNILSRISAELLRQGGVTEAIPFLREWVAEDPRASVPLLQLAQAEMQAGDLAASAGHLERVLAISPSSSRARSLLGIVRIEMGQEQAGMQLLEAAARAEPGLAELHYNLGYGRMKQGDAVGAEQAFRTALSLNPEDADVQFQLGLLLSRKRSWEEAGAMLAAAAAQRPDLAMGHFHAGKALMEAGHYSEARRHLELAHAIDKPNPLYMNELAWILATAPDGPVRDGRLALELAQNAQEAVGRGDPVITDTIAASYAENGDFGQAVAECRDALAIAGGALAVCIEERLRLYESGQPYRMTVGRSCP